MALPASSQSAPIPEPQDGVTYCSPAIFKPFDGYPGVCALARDMNMRILWCNAEYARMCERPQDSLIGTTLHDLMTKEMADERTARMREIWNSGKLGRYFQVWKDHRYLTNIWRLDPRAYGCDGLFVLMTRGLATQLPGLDMAEVGVITTPHLDMLDKLSRRELEVLYLTALGMSTDEIARHIHRAPKTVENHIASIMEKMNFQRRTELVRFAVERGILGFAEHEWTQIAARKSDGRERD
jgi:DNA-binding CsgD family transcriptional regulator